MSLRIVTVLFCLLLLVGCGKKSDKPAPAPAATPAPGTTPAPAAPKTDYKPPVATGKAAESAAFLKQLMDLTQQTQLHQAIPYKHSFMLALADTPDDLTGMEAPFQTAADVLKESVRQLEALPVQDVDKELLTSRNKYIQYLNQCATQLLAVVTLIQQQNFTALKDETKKTQAAPTERISLDIGLGSLISTMFTMYGNDFVLVQAQVPATKESTVPFWNQFAEINKTFTTRQAELNKSMLLPGNLDQVRNKLQSVAAACREAADRLDALNPNSVDQQLLYTWQRLKTLLRSMSENTNGLISALSTDSFDDKLAILEAQEGQLRSLYMGMTTMGMTLQFKYNFRIQP